MITIFAALKPFSGHIGTIQRNAIASWLRLDPDVQVILFGNEEGTEQVAAEFGVCYVPEIARNEYGTPLLNDVFTKAELLATNDLLCYANGDIVLMSDFLQAVKTLRGVRDRFLMVGECWNLNVTEPLSGTFTDWEEDLRGAVTESGQRRGPWALDYFVMTRGFFNTLPAFALGRAHFDNWLIWKASEMRAAVDASSVVSAIHQNHDYSHVSAGMEWVYNGEEAKRNFELADRKNANLFDATYRLTPDGLEQNWKGKFPLRQFRHLGWPIQRVFTAWWLRGLKITKPLRRSLGLSMPALRRLKVLVPPPETIEKRK